MMHIDTQTFTAAEQAAQARARRERLGMAPKAKNLAAEAKRERERLAQIKREQLQEAAEEALRLSELAPPASLADMCTTLNITTTFTIGEEPEQIFDMRIVGGIPRPTINSIEMSVLKEHPGVQHWQLRQNTRNKAIVRARQHCWVKIRELRPDLSLPQIGRLYGGFDHSTVAKGVDRYLALMSGEYVDKRYYPQGKND